MIDLYINCIPHFYKLYIFLENYIRAAIKNVCYRLFLVSSQVTYIHTFQLDVLEVFLEDFFQLINILVIVVFLISIVTFPCMSST